MGEYYLEVWGEMCPVPLLKAEKKLIELADNDVLILETDHSCTARTVENWAKKKKYQVTIEQVDVGIWRIGISRRGSAR